jgi:hypothetical protein
MAIELKPNHPDGYVVRAALKSKSNDFDGAISDYDIAINFVPKNALLYVGRGFAKTKSSYTTNESACIDFQKAKELGMIEAEELIRQYCK